MRKFTLAFTALIMSTFVVKAQVVATFDSFSLLTTYPDTAYVNYSMPGTDVGFLDGDGYFPCLYDTGFGSSYWDGGFAYSNRADSVTLDYLNDMSAITAVGNDSSTGYAIGYQGYALQPYIRITDTAAAGDSVLGFYVTNTTYAFKAIRDGYLGATKFGGVSGNDPDWFVLTMKGYNNGMPVADSVNFYLADYRFANNADDYIVGDWQWVDLTSLGLVDSVTFFLNSTDSNQFGILTPAYFAMDNFTTKTSTPNSVGGIAKANAAKLYPNPATETLYVEVNNPAVKQLKVMDITGKLMLSQSVTTNKEAINISSLPSGTYYLQLVSDTQTVGSRFVKQ